ncbi:MAG: efflux RND transporter periplasmic adaptor subunit [Betaproteobacteria bacterium]|nr:efflux RND transporter periplasmic adaptor subunit [Betaproteobacteria bacterium]
MTLRKTLLLGFIATLVATTVYFAFFRSTPRPTATEGHTSAPLRHPLAQALIDDAKSQPLQLGESDWLAVRATTLESNIPVSGTVKAVNAALVKARVPGELMVLKVREGMTVRRGDVLGQIDPRDYEARVKEREAQLRAAQAQLDTAERNFESNRQLVDRGFLSQNTGENARSTRDAAQASCDAARFQLEQARKALDDTWLLANIDGKVQERFALQGEKLAGDARVLSLIDTSDMEAEVLVPLQLLQKVRIGQTMQLAIEGVNEGVPAQVVRINPATSGNTRQVAVFLRLESSSQAKAGSFVEGKLPSQSLNPVIALPLSAVRSADQTSPYIWVIQEHKLVRRPVSTGLRDPAKLAPNGSRGMVEIKSGLVESEIVVVATFGSQEGRLVEGRAVQLANSKASEAGQTK